MKWLFLSIFLIYAFTTPGEYLAYFPTNIVPTKEGLLLGSLQIAKLLIALAMLTLLFATNSKQQLMSGLSLLLSPLNLLGFHTDKFTARLLLTLNYVEVFATRETFKFSFDAIDHMLADTELVQVQDKEVVLQNISFKWTDKLCLVLLMLGTLAIIYSKVLDFKGLF